MYKVLKFDSIIKHSKFETRYEKLTVFGLFREFKEINTAFKLVDLELYFLGNIFYETCLKKQRKQLLKAKLWPVCLY